ncbi:RodZ family helix-turn-helix domain-containing protein [Fibrobacter sp. UWR2]|uniref:helix-turn-helix domain-containing protein n=1 Tax=Fibrobacter sp. UWR2 TaxID=1964352 RepID=UPI001E56E386|nr:helix-turn-helix domain-containing protein [Fibrobacter sp. UWR2]
MNTNPIEDKRPDERLGAYLTRVREAKGLSVEDLATVTKLTVKNITLIESGDWKAFPVEAYLRGYLNSICEKLGLEPRRIVDYYLGEAGTKFTSLLSPVQEKAVKVSPMTDEERKPRSKAVPIVIVLLGLAFVVGSHFLKEMGESDQAAATAEKASVEASADAQPADAPLAEMPDGAEVVPPDSVQTDSSAKDSAAKSNNVVTQAVVDEAVKKSELPASATIFISSTSETEEAVVSTKTHFELVGSGSMASWIGLKRHEDDGSFVKEANIAVKDSRMIYDTDDTLYVVVGEPRAISKMLLNGKEVKIPEVKFGRVAKFRVFAGEIVKIKGGR